MLINKSANLALNKRLQVQNVRLT